MKWQFKPNKKQKKTKVGVKAFRNCFYHTCSHDLSDTQASLVLSILPLFFRRTKSTRFTIITLQRERERESAWLPVNALAAFCSSSYGKQVSFVRLNPHKPPSKLAWYLLFPLLLRHSDVSTADALTRLSCIFHSNSFWGFLQPVSFTNWTFITSVSLPCLLLHLNHPPYSSTKK